MAEVVTGKVAVTVCHADLAQVVVALVAQELARVHLIDVELTA